MLKRIVYTILVLSTPIINSCNRNNIIPEKTVNPFDKNITAILVENSNVWIGTFKNGLYQFNGDSWITYKHPEYLVSDTIRALTASNNMVWVGTNLGISKFENQNWINITKSDGLINNDIRSLDCDLENNIWIGTRKNRMIKYDGISFINYHVNPAVSGEGELGHIHNIAHDLTGNIWVGSCVSGLSKFDGVRWTDNIHGITTFAVCSICDLDGDIWIGHYFGAYKFSNGVWTKYTDADGLTGNNILCFTIDQQNNIWIGTDSGLSKFDGLEWENYTTDNVLLNNKVTALACDQNGDIWIGSSVGLLKLNF